MQIYDYTDQVIAKKVQRIKEIKDSLGTIEKATYRNLYENNYPKQETKTLKFSTDNLIILDNRHKIVTNNFDIDYYPKFKLSRLFSLLLLILVISCAIGYSFIRFFNADFSKYYELINHLISSIPFSNSVALL